MSLDSPTGYYVPSGLSQCIVDVPQKIDGTLKKLSCPSCGAPYNPTLKCDYCGSSYSFNGRGPQVSSNMDRIKEMTLEELKANLERVKAKVAAAKVKREKNELPDYWQEIFGSQDKFNRMIRLCPKE